jgi:subtilisin family serine protease
MLDKIADLVERLFRAMINQPDDPLAAEPLVWQISMNRRAGPALDKSVPAVKGDAASTLFRVNCREIAWAVLDSGIDTEHEAFKEGESTRIRRSFDFRNIRRIISLDSDPSSREARLKDILASQNREMTREERSAALADLEVLANDAREGRPIHWELVEKYITVKRGTPPYSPHGTHVAGIIGASEVSDGVRGMCPDIYLYDFRILSRSIEDTEFAVIAALQYIRHLNERSSFVAIHGVNLSISIPHDVRNFACGRTPVCNECERLIDSGVVVVAAAGNRGYQRFETRDGPYESYAAFSITDPGNADGVITVGATHRYWPHTYGVSFFSSRGPTGDGRLKPDLVAPGERIRAPLPGDVWGELDGTSMAAPHVSGAAAMLMARYSELIGRPRRIKQILCDTATDLGRDRSFQGHGMLDVLRAFQSV